MPADPIDPTSSSGSIIDPTPYIRTYAKDVAALTGQKTTVVKPSAPPEDKNPARAIVGNDSLLVSEAPSSKPANLSQLEKEAEQIGVQKQTEEEIEASLKENGTPSDVLQSIDLPSIQPGDIRSGMTTTGPVEDVVTREAVLARLRAKIAGKVKPVSQTPMMPSSFTSAPLVSQEPSTFVPQPPEPPPAPLPAPEPLFIPPPPEPVAPPPPVFVPPTPPPPVFVPPPQAPEPAASVQKFEPAPFHSFSSDFADRIDEQHASKFSVLAAEKDAEPVREKPRRNLHILPILAGIVLVIAGGAGIFAAYRFMTSTALVPAVPSGSYLIVPDEKIALSGNSTSLLDALAQQATQPLPANTVLLTYINAASTTDAGIVQVPASGVTFIADLNLQAPDILLRNIEPSSMVGIVNDGTQTRPFFILRVDSYESTFAGMLDWESTIGNNLALLYPAYPASVQQSPVVATSTTTTTSKGTTTVKTVPVTTVSEPAVQTAPAFIDEVVDNRNARALKDSQNRTILMYGYADNQTLVIARDEAAFTLLVDRLQASQQ